MKISIMENKINIVDTFLRIFEKIFVVIEQKIKKNQIEDVLNIFITNRNMFYNIIDSNKINNIEVDRINNKIVNNYIRIKKYNIIVKDIDAEINWFHELIYN